jgi:hypothetical protein
MRDIAIFSGASHTFGLGLEIEFRDRYNDDAWLSKNGLMLPLPRELADKPFWRKYRWSKLLCEDLGLIEHNIHDNGDIPMGGNAVESIWWLTKDESIYKELFEKTKYVFLELGYTRWWDEKLHGSGDGKDYPHTICEIIQLINNPKSDNSVVAKALQWIKDLDETLYWKETLSKYKKIKETYPEIQFVLIPWNGDVKEVDKETSADWVDFKGYSSANAYISQNKLRIGDIAKAFNGNYKYVYKDDHASSVGHRHIANIIINYLNKNEDLEYIKITKQYI